MSSERPLIVVGAGVAGLAFGCYAQMNGYQTIIMEMNSRPGGLCTAWQRKDYTVEGCIHHLAGAGPQSRLHRMWQELGTVDGQEILFHDRLVRVEDESGQCFDVYTDVDRLEEHLKELSPVDTQVIDDYLRAIRQFMAFELLAVPAGSRWDLVRLLPKAGLFMKWGRLTMEGFAQRFQDHFLRRAFPFIQYGFSQIPTLIHLSFLAGCAQKTLGFPRGGSLAFTRSIEKRYLELGGEIQYQSRVQKILVEQDRATGIVLEDGNDFLAERVIAAGDGYATVFDLLEGQYTDKRLREYFEHSPKRQDMNLTISFGVVRDLQTEPPALCLLLDQPVTVAGENRYRLDIEIHRFESGLVPAGKALIQVRFNSRYAFWKELAVDRSLYQEEKSRAEAVVLEVLEKRFPGIRHQVEVTDVATPLTVERYTGNWQGLQAWPAPRAGFFNTLFKGYYPTLPGLQNVYRIGQWAGTIGLSSVALSGRKMVRRLCREDKRTFQAFIQKEENQSI